MASESEFLGALSEIFGTQSDQVLVGIGDDAAVVRAQTPLLALSTDMAVEDVHFRRAWSSLAEIGAKVVAANLADIFAMGGSPRYLLVSTGLPASFTVAEVRELASGMKSEADKVGAFVVGGDLVASQKLVISVAVYGEVERPILRSGARPGDAIVLSDLPGFSAAGLSLLQSGISDDRTRQHRQPEVRYGQAAAMVDANVTAMCDVSDGLVSELSNLSRSSKVRMSIERERLKEFSEFDSLDEIASSVNRDAFEWILHGGEDHVFLATVQPDSMLPDGWVEIGRVESGSGVVVDGVMTSHEGFSHFR